jgi:cell division protein FtsZ
MEILSKDKTVDLKGKHVRIGVFGLGGAGGNALNHMYNIATDADHTITFYACNTDAQALKSAKCNSLLLGQKLTNGLGAGGDPVVGSEAALECLEEIQSLVSKFDMVFLAAGLGGGTGNGSIEVFCDVAKSLGVLCVTVCTLPFKIEGKKRSAIALRTKDKLNSIADLNITIPNDNLRKHLGTDATFLEAFRSSNDVLASAVDTVTSIVGNNGLVNVDFNDIKSVIKSMGAGIITYASSKGDLRAKNAINSALNNPVLEEIDITQAKSAIVNICAGASFTLGEYEHIGEHLENQMHPDANIIIGTRLKHKMDEHLSVHLIVTGFENSNEPKEEKKKPKSQFSI